MRRVLCDTCALIWLATGDARLSRMVRTIIRDAELLCFSSISICEIARKVKAGENIRINAPYVGEAVVTIYLGGNFVWQDRYK